MPTSRFFALWRHCLAGALLAGTALLAQAQNPPQQADPPGRVAYLSAQEGAAFLASPGASGWSPAALNWPVATGSRLGIEAGARTELHAGRLALRLGGPAQLSVTELDDDTAQFALTEGTLSLRVRELRPGERIEIDTPQLALVAQQPGEYRLDVDPRADTTRLAVLNGAATVYGANGQPTEVGAGQQLVFAGRGLSVAQAGPVLARDGFDQWVAGRDALEDQSLSARYLSRDMPGYQLLDSHGEWARDATYGSVWYPSVGVADWAPYRYGRWSWIEPWGWTWVDDAPWGFAPSHYGRWAQIGPRWAWVPGPPAPRPVYAPALVAFMGGGGDRWGVALGGGRPGAAWFPLAPGEYWEPPYRASSRYLGRVNPGFGGRERPHPPHDGYLFQRRPQAITVAPHEQFNGRGDGHGRPPRFMDGSRLPPGALQDSRPVAPPPRSAFPTAPGLAPVPQLAAPRPDVPPPRQRPPQAGFERGNPPAVREHRPWQLGEGAPQAAEVPGYRRMERERVEHDSRPRDPGQRPWPSPRPPEAQLPPPRPQAPVESRPMPQLGAPTMPPMAGPRHPPAPSAGMAPPPRSPQIGEPAGRRAAPDQGPAQRRYIPPGMDPRNQP